MNNPATNAPIFDESIVGNHLSKLDLPFWQTVLNFYNNQQYKETVLAVLDYIDKDITKTRGNATLDEFVIPHGSFQVTISLKDNTFTVRAPFLKLPSTGAIALLRQLTEINFSFLDLSQIVLHDNELYFEYSCPFETCEPYKLYNIFNEICRNGDYYDDLFIEKFKAEHIVEPPVKSFTPEQKDQAWQKFQEYVDEGLAYFDYFQSKRWDGLYWEALINTLKKIDYFMGPQGFLRSDIEKNIGDLNNRSLPFMDVVARGKDFLLKLKAMDRAKLESCLYISNCFISVRVRADLGHIQNVLRPMYDRARNDRISGNHMSTTSGLFYAIFELFYGSDLGDAAIAEKIINTAKTASGKTWEEASDILWKGLTEIMDMKVGQDQMPVSQ